MTPQSKRKLGLLLSTSLQHPNLETVIRLTETALAADYLVYLYLIDEGAQAMDHPRLNDLTEQGLKLFVCAYGAERHHVPLSGNATPCGLVVLSDLVKGCDQFISFN